MSPKTRPSDAPAPITPGELRIELQLEGFRSIVSAGFLSLAQFLARMETQLARIAMSLETQNRLLAQRTNGEAEHASFAAVHDTERER